MELFIFIAVVLPILTILCIALYYLIPEKEENAHDNARKAKL